MSLSALLNPLQLNHAFLKHEQLLANYINFNFLKNKNKNKMKRSTLRLLDGNWHDNKKKSNAEQQKIVRR